MVMNRKVPRHKVLFIDCGSGRGGSTKFLYYMLKYLDKGHFEPIVAFYFSNDGPDTEWIKTLGVHVFFLDDKREQPEYVPVKWLMGRSQSILLHRLKVIARFL